MAFFLKNSLYVPPFILHISIRTGPAQQLLQGIVTQGQYLQVLLLA
jgi:hypothetical protein